MAADSAPDLWPDCGYSMLAHDAEGRLRPTDDFWRLLLARPELAPVPESCGSERALHAALLDAPAQHVTAERLAQLQDDDARDNHRVFLRLRDRLLRAGTVEACYVGLFDGRAVATGGHGSTGVDIPPLFVHLLAQLIVRNLLAGCADAFEARAAELLFRPQRITVRDGRVLAADRDALDQRQHAAGLGEIGKLLQQAQVPLRALEAPVLSADNAAHYWTQPDRRNLLLDLTHGITRDVGHGVQFQLTQKNSGLAALASVLQRWVLHLLGVRVTIEPLQRIDDAQWRWHVGLDAESTALLNDLYDGRDVDAERQRRLISLFALRFEDSADMRADVAGKPVYLGIAHGADGVLRMKPQNLLMNLPLAAAAG